MQRFLLAFAFALALVAPAAAQETSTVAGTIVSVAAEGTFTLDVDGTAYTVAVSADATYAPAGTTLADLDPGDEVEVVGRVSGSTIAASQVTLRAEDFECSDDARHGACVSEAARQAKGIEPGRERGQFVSCVARGEDDCSFAVEKDGGEPEGPAGDEGATAGSAERADRPGKGAGPGRGHERERRGGKGR